MHIINYVSISFRQAKKVHRASGSREGHWGWHPNVLGHAARHSTCVSRAHTPTTSDVTARATTSFDQHVEHFIIMWNNIIYYVENCIMMILLWNIILSCGTFTSLFRSSSSVLHFFTCVIISSAPAEPLFTIHIFMMND